VDGATAAVIRGEDAHRGVRVTMNAELAAARHFRVDVNVGDPITPAPQELHLTRRGDPTNRRVQVLELTEQGEAVFERLARAAIAFDRELRAGIPDRDLATVRSVFAKFRRNLEQ
jgi:hypothetical protein